MNAECGSIASGLGRSGRRSERIRMMFLLISVVSTFLLLAMLQREGGLPRIREILSSVSGRGLLVFTLCSCVTLLVRALRYRVLVHALEPQCALPSYTAFVLITAIRNVLVDFFPARVGDASFILYARRAGVPLLTAVNSFGMSIVLDLVVLLALAAGFIGIAPLITAHSELLPAVPPLLSGALIGGAIAVLLLFVTLVPRVLAWVANLPAGADAHPPGSRTARLQETAAALGRELTTLSSARSLIALLGLTALLRILKYGSLYILLLAVVAPMGVGPESLDPLLTTVAFIAGEAASSLPFSGVMGFGAYEGAWTTILGFAGGQIPSPATVIFSVHLLTQLVACGCGLIAFACFPFLNPKPTAAHRN